jgi:hypothetical protein
MEQTINIVETPKLLRFINTFKIALLAVFVLCLSGCIPQGDETVNTKLFKNKQEVSQKAHALHLGMSKRTVFAKLKIDPERFDRMSVQEVQMAVYGNSQVHGTPEQLEAFKQRLAHYEGYSLPYRDIKADGTLGFGSFKVTKKGCDLHLVLVFDHGHLIRATVEGAQSLNQVNDENLWPALIRRGIGFAL